MADNLFLNVSSSLQMINLLVAGRDTVSSLHKFSVARRLTHIIQQTSTTLTYAFYMLAEHPDIAERLRNEIFDVVGSTNRPTYDNLRDLKFLRAFLNGWFFFHIFCSYLFDHEFASCRGVEALPTSVSIAGIFR